MMASIATAAATASSDKQQQLTAVRTAATPSAGNGDVGQPGMAFTSDAAAVGNYDRLTSDNIRQLERSTFLNVGAAAASPEIFLDSISTSSDVPPAGRPSSSIGSDLMRLSSGFSPRGPKLSSEHGGNNRRRSSSSALTMDHSKLSTRHGCVTIFFSDLIGFSSWAHELDPEIVMATLDDLYTRLDNIILEEMPGVYKVG